VPFVNSFWIQIMDIGAEITDFNSQT
jgi:hypothetical protein